MITLRFRIEADSAEPYIVRLNDDRRYVDRSFERTTVFDGQLEEVSNEAAIYSTSRGALSVFGTNPSDTHGDVLFVLPERKIAHRFIRANSPHNTFLVTERCDQLCVMCSQPPKKHHNDMFPYFEAAALLAGEGQTIGISGGEPLLYKKELFEMLQRVTDARPDLSFHILTNGQHITEDDAVSISALPLDRILWGIPLYSHDASLHDELVGKDGAYQQLMPSLAGLALLGARIELRTVLMQPNSSQLPELAKFICSHLPFIDVWAIMQLENIGYGRQNWDTLFFDSSREFQPVANALNYVRSRGLEAKLYNFPLCTVPDAYRELAPSTISDWKRSYPDTCAACSAQKECSGFFEWHPHNRSYEGMGPL